MPEPWKANKNGVNGALTKNLSSPEARPLLIIAPSKNGRLPRVFVSTRPWPCCQRELDSLPVHGQAYFD